MWMMYWFEAKKGVITFKTFGKLLQTLGATA
jgi:hypothetical protein